ncbi:MAG: cytosine permease [Synergistaceae bacterium]|nr:cytosine permease [Synergistaceae bacterium]
MEKNNKSAPSFFQHRLNLYEYAFLPVPAALRRGTVNLFMGIAGYTMSLSCLMIGAIVGYALPFWEAVCACVLGDAVLLFTGILMGVIACESGWSTSFLSRRIFGKRASSLFSICIILLSINWVGLNGDAFARMIITVFPAFPLPMPVISVLIIALWAATSAYGWRSFELLCWIAVPLVSLFLAIGGERLWSEISGMGFIDSFIPSGELSVTSAAAVVTGNYIFGCIISPDMCRFAASKRSVVTAAVPAYIFSFFIFNIFGVVMSQFGDSYLFSVSASKIGQSSIFFVIAVFCLWTTEHYNIYAGSLAMQNIFQGTAVDGNLSHRMATCVIGGLAAAYASFGALDFIMTVLSWISVVIPPVVGMFAAEYFIVRRSNEKRDINWVSFAAWGIGGLTGFLAQRGDFLIPPAVSIAVSALVYGLLSKFRAAEK